MILSFDLDDTLINGKITFPVEKQNIVQKIIGFEKIRLGTVSLFRKLSQDGHQVYIYTTSYRNPLLIKLNFLSYGILINKVINANTHNKIMKNKSFRCSKYPPMFNIDLHIDDSEGVKKEGLVYNFETLIIKNEADWSSVILNKINSK
ncbi:hypothetical protein O2K51_06775 [Apibacter raozihei]|uniref:hypothetical protein n=1 Tax=Apibacter raozihei TaxID=2500547 RepID=UPI000FE35501|nr:hypothetical protein [Apibacter raozihei]